MARSDDTPADVDKQTIHGWWLRQALWRDDLDRRLSHKALDIPEQEPMENVGNRSGMTWRELLAIGALLLTGGGMYQILNQQTVKAPAPAVDPVDSEYEIRFYDQDGRPVEVPHISQRPNA